ncbi:MAG: hypothetical protein ACR2JB_28820 [Bryobacteraceae bacterium]
MAGTIGPIVYGAQRSRLWFVLLSLHSLGYVCGALTIGAILGVVGALVIPFEIGVTLSTIFTGVVCLLFCARELRFLTFRAPQFRRQVPHSWRRFRPEVMIPLYAGVLGMGILTRIEASSLYPVVIWVLLSRSPMVGIAVMSGFGLGRAIPYWTLTGFQSAQQCTSAAHAVQRHRAILSTLNGAILGFAGASMLILSMRH